ncbi:MAG: hypothetical protein GF411_17150 [Candidatus Lokiarchaeota archaeon]|nr:hypothetical protein [Candidatus Lokiarchaeota archaeon]
MVNEKEEPEVEDKVPRFDESVVTKDEKPHTWLNEELWKKIFFKVLANLVYVVGLAIITDGIVGFDTNKFITGLQVIILPIIWSGLDAQSRNKEIQARIASDEALEKAKILAQKEKQKSDKAIAQLKKEAENKQLEIYRLKAVLMAKTDNVEALDEAVKKAEQVIKTADSLDTDM